MSLDCTNPSASIASAGYAPEDSPPVIKRFGGAATRPLTRPGDAVRRNRRQHRLLQLPLGAIDGQPIIVDFEILRVPIEGPDP
jgi:hypothetical protein